MMERLAGRRQGKDERKRRCCWVPTHPACILRERRMEGISDERDEYVLQSTVDNEYNGVVVLKH